MKLLEEQNTRFLLLWIPVLLLVANTLFAQQPNYTEVHVYGWGMAINRGMPVFFDIDNDGLMDMLIGNESGRIWHYKQVSGNEFILISQYFNNIDVGEDASPTITDIDGDGLIDLIIGSNNTIERFEQDSVGSYHFSKIEGELVDSNIGSGWAPAFEDLNNNGLLDLIICESLSNLNYFVQDSINAPTFSLIDENWLDWSGKVFQSPLITDLENDGLWDLLIGNIGGWIAHLVQDSLNALTFHEVTTTFAGIKFGEHAAPQILDIDQDEKLDLYVGEYSTGLNHYEQESPGSETYVLLNDNVLGMRDFGINIGYTVEDIDHDGLLDMLVSPDHDTNNYNLLHYEQEQKGSLNFTLITKNFNNIEADANQYLYLYDINGNGLLDLFIGNKIGFISRYEQDEINSYSFSLQEEKFNNMMKVGQNAQVCFTDLDGDSLLDMIVGDGYGYLRYYKQDNLNTLTFSYNGILSNIQLKYNSSPVFTDIDGDNLLDLVIGNSEGILYYYEQDSIHSLNFTQISDNFGDVQLQSNIIPRFADINNDGKVDILAGDKGGGITLYLRNDEMDLTPPDIPQNLSALVEGDYVHLSWSPCAAPDLMLYNIYRGLLNDVTAAEYVYSVNAGSVEFIDSTLVNSGTYFYWVSALDMVGNESTLSLSDSIYIALSDISSLTHKAKTYYLFQNYPNPFNPETTIEFQMPYAAEVTLSVYNILGKKVATLLNHKRLPAGSYKYKWNGTGKISGLYLYKISAGDFTTTRKMILLK
jgi:hypothetical protein